MTRAKHHGQEGTDRGYQFLGVNRCKEALMCCSYRVLAVVLAFSIGVWPLGDVPTLAVEASTNPELIKQEIIQYGVGANLKLRLADGKKLKGSLVFLGEEGFELRAKPKEAPRHIAYSQVTEVKPAKLVYRAKGQPDAVEARRTVLGLGVGRHIQVKTTTGNTYHGNIQTIDTDTFTMLPDRQTSSVEIPFSQVQYVEQNLSTAAKIVIAVVVVATIVVVVLVVVYVDAITKSF
jgi:ribosome maturation factor RimP